MTFTVSVTLSPPDAVGVLLATPIARLAGPPEDAVDDAAVVAGVVEAVGAGTDKEVGVVDAAPDDEELTDEGGGGENDELEAAVVQCAYTVSPSARSEKSASSSLLSRYQPWNVDPARTGAAQAVSDSTLAAIVALAAYTTTFAGSPPLLSKVTEPVCPLIAPIALPHDTTDPALAIPLPLTPAAPPAPPGLPGAPAVDLLCPAVPVSPSLAVAVIKNARP